MFITVIYMYVFYVYKRGNCKASSPDLKYKDLMMANQNRRNIQM
jgi:hypothetical protein